MDIKEVETRRIQERLAYINDEKNKPGFFKSIVIAAGDPVLSTYSDEYIALKNMLDLLKGDLADYKKYLEERKKTKLQSLTEDEVNLITNYNTMEDPFEEPEIELDLNIPPMFTDQKGEFIDAYYELQFNVGNLNDVFDIPEENITRRYRSLIDFYNNPSTNIAPERKSEELRKIERSYLILSKHRTEYDESFRIHYGLQQKKKEITEKDFYQNGVLIDFFQMLNVSSDAPEEDITRSYNALKTTYAIKVSDDANMLSAKKRYLELLDIGYLALTKKRAIYEAALEKVKQPNRPSNDEEDFRQNGFKDEDGQFIDAYYDLGLKRYGKESLVQTLSLSNENIFDYYKRAKDYFSTTQSVKTEEERKQILERLDRAYKILSEYREDYDKAFKEHYGFETERKITREDFYQNGVLIDFYKMLNVTKDTLPLDITRAYYDLKLATEIKPDDSPTTVASKKEYLRILEIAHLALTKEKATYDEAYEKALHPEQAQENDQEQNFKDERGQFINAYTDLGLHPDATSEEITRAYNLIANHYKNAHARGEGTKEQLDRNLKILDRAYDILSNHKEAYDQAYNNEFNQSNNPNGEGSNPDDTPEQQQGDEGPRQGEERLQDLIEVESITPWKWIRDHKKTILIAAGLTVLTVSIVAAVSAIAAAAPAMIAATKAQEVAGLASRMIANGQHWAGASAAEQLTLQGANMSLAQNISSITGVANNFGASGWTFGGESLASFAKSAAEAATTASQKVSFLNTITTASKIGILGGGLLGVTGTILPRRKTNEYYTIKKLIEEFKTASENMTRADNVKTIEMLSSRILTSTLIEPREKDKLLRKLKRTAKKVNSMMDLRQGENLDIEDTHEFVIERPEAEEQPETAQEDEDIRIYTR